MKTDRRMKFCWLFIGALFLLVSCQPSGPDAVTEVETVGVLEVGSSTCTVEGEILSIGESGVSSYGFVWSDQLESSPENWGKIDLGEAYAEGIFQYSIRKLTAETTYYVRAYAMGNGTVTYGTLISFTTSEVDVPQLITFGIYDYTSTGGFSGGNITNDGGGTIMTSGICWATRRFPDLEDSHTDEGGGHDSFESYLNNLTPYTVYYVRAYAINEAGTGYGQEVAFQTYWDESPVTDVDGNEYPTVQIGEQVWMAMNLRAIHYADGTPLNLVEPAADWEGLEVDAAAYCFYGNLADQEIYGALYSWGAATRDPATAEAGEEVQGVCPDGWHLPGDEEWKTLEMELGMTWLTADKDQWRGFEEGGMLKIAGTEYWNEPNEMATNESGFSAAPAGIRSADGIFSGRGDHTVYWTATGVEPNSAWVRALHTMRGEIKREYVNRKAGYSVRCIMDE
ncbi:MAG: fibrobacter succinogenes major paralogous domain-containing protein [Bacteroidales bacterium]